MEKRKTPKSRKRTRKNLPRPERWVNQAMPNTFAAVRVELIQSLIPRPPADVLPLRAAFAKIAPRQWQQFVPPVLGDAPLGSNLEQVAKVRFMATMYARACYSMLLVSVRGPWLLRWPIRVATGVPLNRGTAIRCGSWLLSSLDYLVPQSVQRQLALMATLMGLIDMVLDETAPAGQDAVLRIASMLSPKPQSMRNPHEGTLATLTRAVRAGESEWQTEYWDAVLLPAIQSYCTEEALAVANAPDETGFGHRWAGIEAAIKGMWYVIGPCMGLAHAPEGFHRQHWNREQQWMADTSLLMQMIDDWVDQDEDRSARSTPVITGDWNANSIQELYAGTITGLAALLEESGIHKQVFKNLFSDLYADYLYAAAEAMQSGLAA
jgi:hypothetical protein